MGNKPVRSGFRSMTRACQREDWKGKGKEWKKDKGIIRNKYYLLL